MDARDFDALARALTAGNSRRRLLALLTTLPVVGGLLGIFSADDTEGSGRRRRRKKRHKHGKGRRHARRKHNKKPQKCTPEQIAQTCAGSCGGSDGCGGTCTCGIGQTCLSGACVACELCGETCGCPTGQLCVDDACVQCDVCAVGCAHQTVQEAITAALTSIRICPGTYAENSGGLGAITISGSVTLIGAGDGANDSTNTVLRPAVTNKPVIAINASSGSNVRLEGLRITGGTGGFGPGVFVLSASLTMESCTIIGNTPGATAQGGGLFIGSAQVSLLNTHIIENTGGWSGGAYVGDGALTLDALSRITGNTGLDNSYNTGGLYVDQGGSATLPSVDNVTGNTPQNCDANPQGSITGPGAICLTT